MAYPESYKRLKIFQFSTYIFSADITPEMLKPCRVTKVKKFFLVLVCVLDFARLRFLSVIEVIPGLCKLIKVIPMK